MSSTDAFSAGEMHPAKCKRSAQPSQQITEISEDLEEKDADPPASCFGCSRDRIAVPHRDVRRELQGRSAIRERSSLIQSPPSHLVTIGQRMTHHHAFDAAVWAMPMLHFNGMRSAVMESGLINLKKQGGPGLTRFFVREFTFLF